MDIFTAAVVGVWLWAASYQLVGLGGNVHVTEHGLKKQLQRACLITLVVFVLYAAEKVIWPT
jgi:hypothetical protein